MRRPPPGPGGGRDRLVGNGSAAARIMRSGLPVRAVRAVRQAVTDFRAGSDADSTVILRGLARSAIGMTTLSTPPS